MHKPIPILMYHLVTPEPPVAFRKYAVSTKMFAAQMQWLSLTGYEAITLEQLFAARCGQGCLPAQPVILTFDDGLRACVEHAVPVLQRYGFSAVFFLVSGSMGKTSRWMQSELGLEFPVADWTVARELEAAGFQCGAHTVTHPHLPDLSSAACRAELVEARHTLEDNLGHTVVHMAYPYGTFNERVRGLVVEAGYQSACSVLMGLSTENDDPFALRRVPIDGDDSFFDFICRLKTAWTAREIFRQKTYGAWRRFRQRRKPVIV